MADTPVALAVALQRAGWNARRFAEAINRCLVSRGLKSLRIHATAPYQWLRLGYMPHDPIPGIAAELLSAELGYPVTVDQLWPGHKRSYGPALSAATGLSELGTVEDFTQALDELVAAGIGGNDPVGHGSGVDLAAAAQARGPAAVHMSRRPEHERVLPSQVELIAVHVAALRRQDDRHGGGVLSLRYIVSELRGVLDLLHYADYERAVGHRLLTIVADLAQLIGWVHFDAARYGAAERYLLLSQRVALGLEDAGRAANAVGMLAYVSAFAGHGREATHIAAEAERICPEDPVLRSRITGRIATAAAASGDLYTFRAASERAQELLAGDSSAEQASYLYYMEPEQLIAEAGQGLVVLAQHDTVHRKALIDDAVGLLTPISAAGARPEYPRSALLHGGFLTEAHLMRDDVEAATCAARATLTRLSEVQSIRGRTRLRKLRPMFARRHRSRVVAEFLPEFDAALSST